MLVVVLLLSVLPSRCSCHRRRYHRWTTNAGCSYHRHPHLASTFTAVFDAVVAPAAASAVQIPPTQLSLAVAIAAATAVVAAVAVALAAAIAAAIPLASTVAVAAASTDIFASARLASPDAWACGDGGPSRHDALELEAWWRGRASFEQVFWCAAKTSRVNSETTNPTKLPISKKQRKVSDSGNCAKIRAKKKLR